MRQKINNLLKLNKNRRTLLRRNQQLGRQCAFYEAILTCAAEGIMVVNEEGLIDYVNPAMAQLLDCPISSLQGKNFLDLFATDSGEEYENWLQSPFYRHWQERSIYRQNEAYLALEKGKTLPVSLSCAPLPQPQKAMLVMMHDMSLEKKLRQELEALIVTDPLTSLLNRRGFEDTAETALARAKRENQPLVLMFIDLDGFKNINDQWGHNVGDDLLRHLAHQLKAGLRPYDTLARMGGDEFTVLIEKVKPCREAAHIADKVLKLIATPHHIKHEKISLSASIGIACYPEDGEDVTALLRAADMAMYEVKKNGRQHYRFYSERTCQTPEGV